MLTDLLKAKRSSIIKDWTKRIFDSYASETSGFLSKDNDRFSNPVGFTIRDNIEKIIDEVISDRNSASIKILLIDILKIRAVQEFSPSEAVKFIFQLKDTIQAEVKVDPGSQKEMNELAALYSFIDEMALMAFDVYMELRETVNRIRMDEVRNRSVSAAQ